MLKPSAFCLACAFASVFALSIRARAAQATPTPDVASKLRSSRTATRADAVQAVIDHRARASFDALTGAARSETNPEIRLRLLMAAFAVNRSSAVPVLIAALGRDASPLVRAVSAQMLIRLEPEDAVRQAFLNGLANDKDLDVRRSCASGLGYHHTPDAVKALTGAASDGDPELRRRVGMALLRHPKSPTVDQVLDRLESDSDRSVAALVHARRQAAGAKGP
jgi:hypothetical protein